MRTLNRFRLPRANCRPTDQTHSGTGTLVPGLAEQRFGVHVEIDVLGYDTLDRDGRNVQIVPARAVASDVHIRNVVVDKDVHYLADRFVLRDNLLPWFEVVAVVGQHLICPFSHVRLISSDGVHFVPTCEANN